MSIEFEFIDEQIRNPRLDTRYLEPQNTSRIVKFLIDHDMVKTPRAANLIIVCMSLVFLVSAGFIFHATVHIGPVFNFYSYDKVDQSIYKSSTYGFGPG